MTTSGAPNRLIAETSPYLLQHAHNPVDWYPWCQEALNKARQEDKPIFLSIGYSACHWCHVMAHESFENADSAGIMNELFVNIKVDREERPDLDTVYMQSIIAMTGHGGWPLSVFLTPDLKPYFGGTYFPPTMNYNRPGFPQILKQAHDLYRNQKDHIGSRIDNIMKRLNPVREGKSQTFSSVWKLTDGSVAVLAEKFDEACGGFGSGMKFPDPVIYNLLLKHWLRTGSSQSLEMLDKSLTRMAQGGIFDQIGGGFHRYSTDSRWLVPHFEKMLYDNALMAKLYLEVSQATKQEIYKTIPREIFTWTLREMTSDGFYSSQDADTDGEEGRFYVWELKEVLDLLGPRNAEVFARVYGISPTGNWGRKNVLHIRETMEKISEQENIPIFEVNHIIQTGKKILFERREKRKKPGRDEKVLTSWNGLMITAFATGYAVLRDKTFLDAATRCAEFLWSRLWNGDRLLRVYKDGQAKIDGFLDDYTALLEGFIALYEASFELVWVERAVQLADKMIELFWDERDGGFYMTGNQHEKLICRLKRGEDEAMPSSNSIAALALLRLGHLTGKAEYLKKGEGTVHAFSAQIEQRPLAHAGFLSVIEFLSKPPVEIVFSGPCEGPSFEEMMRVVQQDYRPGKILIGGKGAEKLLPLAMGKTAIKGEPTVYLCQNQTCHAPVQDAKALLNLLENPPLIKLNIFDKDKYVAEKTAEETSNFLNAMSKIFKHSGLGKK